MTWIGVSRWMAAALRPGPAVACVRPAQPASHRREDGSERSEEAGGMRADAAPLIDPPHPIGRLLDPRRSDHGPRPAATRRPIMAPRMTARRASCAARHGQSASANDTDPPASGGLSRTLRRRLPTDLQGGAERPSQACCSRPGGAERVDPRPVAGSSRRTPGSSRARSCRRCGCTSAARRCRCGRRRRWPTHGCPCRHRTGRGRGQAARSWRATCWIIPGWCAAAGWRTSVRAAAWWRSRRRWPARPR